MGVRDTVQGRPEILAPGGSLEAIEVAAGHGADAVYAGIGTLNTRARSANLTEAQLPGVIDFLHGSGTRLYVPINVPLRPEDREETARVLALCEAGGVDAVILRDPALMRLCRDRFPALAIHASTQAGVHSVETARRAAELGCRRVILARECSRDDIARIRDALPDLEVEVFVFGAQCFAVSGLCLLGEATTGRSGNYGACSQACRLPYTDESGRNVGHPFSMKDLDLVGDVQALVDLGVAALKIEGRMKSPAWVGCVVSWLRKAVDRPIPGLSSEELDAFHRDVSVLFSRPRTGGFFHGRTDAADQIDVDAPGHRGCDVGDVRTRSTPEGQILCFRTPVDLNIRDGLLLELSPERGGRGDGFAKETLAGGGAASGASRTHAPEAPGGIEFVPLGIRELFDEQRRPAMRLPAGRNVEIPVDVRRPVARVAIHSSDGVRVRYDRVDRRVPGTVVEGHPPTPRFEAVEIRADRIRATLSRGRVRRVLELPVASQPARGEGLSCSRLQKHFGDAAYDLDPGLFVNPSDLKQVRRAMEASFEAEVAASVAAKAREAIEALVADPQPPPRTDAELLAKGPAAISRVTGMGGRIIVAPNGTRFELVPTATGTTVRLASAGFRKPDAPPDGPDADPAESPD